MISLKFAVPEHDQYSRSIHVPIDLHRRSDFALINTLTNDESVSLGPGAYVAIVRLPFGETVFEEFELPAAASDTIVELKTLPQALRTYFTAAPPRQTHDWHSHLRPGWLAFNPFKYELAWVEDGSTTGRFPGPLTFEGPANGRGRYFALLPQRSGAEPSDCYLVGVPASPYRKVEVYVTVEARRPPKLTYRWQRHTATMLLEYVKQGATGRASHLSRVSEIAAMDLVDSKAEDPLAGALGLYVLLSRNALEQIGSRSEKLFEYNPWSADGAVILAAHLTARARATLLELEQRGLPVFSTGFRLAMSLLESYLRSRDHSFCLLTPRAENLFKTLREWASRVVFDEAITMIDLPLAQTEQLRRVVPAR